MWSSAIEVVQQAIVERLSAVGVVIPNRVAVLLPALGGLADEKVGAAAESTALPYPPHKARLMLQLLEEPHVRDILSERLASRVCGLWTCCRRLTADQLRQGVGACCSSACAAEVSRTLSLKHDEQPAVARSDTLSIIRDLFPSCDLDALCRGKDGDSIRVRERGPDAQQAVGKMGLMDNGSGAANIANGVAAADTTPQSTSATRLPPVKSRLSAFVADLAAKNLITTSSESDQELAVQQGMSPAAGALKLLWAYADGRLRLRMRAWFMRRHGGKPIVVESTGSLQSFESVVPLIVRLIGRTPAAPSSPIPSAASHHPLDDAALSDRQLSSKTKGVSIRESSASAERRELLMGRFSREVSNLALLLRLSHVELCLVDVVIHNVLGLCDVNDKVPIVSRESYLLAVLVIVHGAALCDDATAAVMRSKNAELIEAYAAFNLVVTSPAPSLPAVAIAAADSSVPTVSVERVTRLVMTLFETV